MTVAELLAELGFPKDRFVDEVLREALYELLKYRSHEVCSCPDCNPPPERS